MFPEAHFFEPATRQVIVDHKCKCVDTCKASCECAKSMAYCGPDCKCDLEACQYRQTGSNKNFLIIILFNLSILCFKSGCSCSNGSCRDSSCPCFQFAFRCSSNCQCASCLNAQATADISLFVVRESRIEGAGAGVFLSHSSALPSDFLITGTFVSMNCFKISYVFF